VLGELLAFAQHHCELEAAAFADFADDTKGVVYQLAQLFDDGQAQSCAPVFMGGVSVNLGEKLKQR